jgi:hypothetical protein
MPSLVHEAYPPLMLAKKLNNRAAFYIETGRYDRAVSKLAKALKLTGKTDNIATCCTCKHCGLKECVTFSQRRDSSIADSVASNHRTRRHSLISDVSSEEGYIYRLPIHVAPQAMQEGHSMGLTLPLIIIFNMALAHHLSAMEEEQLNRKKLSKVLQLYELAFRWQMEEEDDEQVDCICFTMIISNNLGEIHRAVNDRSKHVMCLQHLLSTMMFLVVDGQQTDGSLELDGFLRNTSQLILQGRCADAA